jgi:hypothetical protein
MNVLHKGIGDSKYRPCPLLQQYVDAGWLGQKVRLGGLGQRRRASCGRRRTDALWQAFAPATAAGAPERRPPPAPAAPPPPPPPPHPAPTKQVGRGIYQYDNEKQQEAKN